MNKTTKTILLIISLAAAILGCNKKEDAYYPEMHYQTGPATIDYEYHNALIEFPHNTYSKDSSMIVVFGTPGDTISVKAFNTFTKEKVFEFRDNEAVNYDEEIVYLSSYLLKYNFDTTAKRSADRMMMRAINFGEKTMLGIFYQLLYCCEENCLKDYKSCNYKYYLEALYFFDNDVLVKKVRPDEPNFSFGVFPWFEGNTLVTGGKNTFCYNSSGEVVFSVNMATTSFGIYVEPVNLYECITAFSFGGLSRLDASGTCKWTIPGNYLSGNLSTPFPSDYEFSTNNKAGNEWTIAYRYLDSADIYQNRILTIDIEKGDLIEITVP